LKREVWVIGGGLAGSEAAWQLAQAGEKVRLFEMRPAVNTPAHHTSYLGELVCSNSLKADYLENAAGLLKEEMRKMNSLVIKAADLTRVPAGGALAVDREEFARTITELLTERPEVEIVRQEITSLPLDQPAIIATGPLTSPGLTQWLRGLFGREYLYFYDAVAPIVTRESIDFSKAFTGSRYERGDAAYINCPLDEEEYSRFWENLVSAERHLDHLAEEAKLKYFEGCMPIEVLAARGRDTIRFGPMKPVGLVDPRTGKRPYAVLQLRPENKEGTLYNLVGCQTSLRWGEQERVFSLIPGLSKAEFIRYGVMHRNTFINSPELLLPTLQWKQRENLFFAGQLIGVEGYVESAAAGLVSGWNMAKWLKGEKPSAFPPETALGALLAHITSADPKHFQPMNINFGIFPPLTQESFGRVGKNKREKYRVYAQRALSVLASIIGDFVE
jgi:methylenetetrahydrofolate--tRNA-(uracil-5-)-methyltransferase